jgi:hypothetical protein
LLYAFLFEKNIVAAKPESPGVLASVSRGLRLSSAENLSAISFGSGRLDTGDLAQPSVTERTTNLLDEK